MKKHLFACFVLIYVFICPAVFASEIKWFTPERPEIVTSFAVGFPYAEDLRVDSNPAEIKVTADMQELYMDAGIAVSGVKFDFATHASYMPLFFNRFRAGLALNYHFYRYSDIFYENDYILAARFKWCKGPVFSVDCGIGLFMKFAVIDILQEYVPYLFDGSYVLDVCFNWKITSWASCFFSLSSTDYFDYPLIGTPFIKFGADFRILPVFGLGVDLTLKYVDMITSAVYLNESILRVAFKVIL